MGSESALLDLYSISQTKAVLCPFGAPLVAMVFRGNATIRQSCCNHWECPACGEQRARQEYRRIVFGSECLADAGHSLFFWTLTCRGREMPLEEAERDYLAWTNVVLSNARARAKRKVHYWSYVQVTERQQRGHPHSHILTTYLPDDAHAARHGDGAMSYTSQWFDAANKSAGLGSQHRISEVEDASAVSRYIAKYLFKASMLTQWPKHWRRVRYSRNWPRPPHILAEIAIPLMKPAQWHEAEKVPRTFIIDSPLIFEIARHRIPNITLRPSDIDF